MTKHSSLAAQRVNSDLKIFKALASSELPPDFLNIFHRIKKNCAFLRTSLLIREDPTKANTYTHANTRTLTPGNTKGGNITVPLTSCLTGLD